MRHTKSAAGMCALFRSKYLTQQFAATVGHQEMFSEGRGGIDQAHHLDEARNLVKVTRGRMQRAQQVDGNRPRRLLARPFFALY